MKFLLLLLCCMSLTSFFYRSTFDCKIPKGLKCKSLYEIKNMVAQGAFDIDNLETSKIKSKRRCILCYRQAKAVQGLDVVNKSQKKPKKYLINLFKSKQSQGERKHT
ncbi:conjugal transfer protein [Orientia tsutsugamushi]|uniref:conjugal transfer protein n=1 Tax=Orientia tsutsugamushi TaxID=784 RepID=UPI003527C817